MRDTLPSISQQDPAPRSRRLVPALGIMAAIFLFSSRSSVPRPPGLSTDATAVVGHFTIYALLALALWLALTRTHLSSGRRLVLAFVATMAYGVSDEFHQLFVAGRTAGFADLAVNAAGAASLLFVLWRRDHAGAAAAQD